MTVSKSYRSYQWMLLVTEINNDRSSQTTSTIRISRTPLNVLIMCRDTATYPGWSPIGGQTQSAYVVEGTKKGDWESSDRVRRSPTNLPRSE